MTIIGQTNPTTSTSLMYQIPIKIIFSYFLSHAYPMGDYMLRRDVAWNIMIGRHMKLEYIDTSSFTSTSRRVSLRIWTPSENLPKAIQTIYSHKTMIKWNKDVFYMEINHNFFNIMVVSHFDMRAMESRSLIFFNLKLVLASLETTYNVNNNLPIYTIVLWEIKKEDSNILEWPIPLSCKVWVL